MKLTDTFWKGVSDFAKGTAYLADPLTMHFGPALI